MREWAHPPINIRMRARIKRERPALLAQAGRYGKRLGWARSAFPTLRTPGGHLTSHLKDSARARETIADDSAP